IQVLLDHHADISIADYNGRTAFSILNSYKNKRSRLVKTNFQIRILQDLIEAYDQREETSADAVSSDPRDIQPPASSSILNQEIIACSSCFETFRGQTPVYRNEYCLLCKECGHSFLKYALNNSDKEIIYFPVSSEESLRHEVNVDFIQELGASEPEARMFLIGQMTQKLKKIENWKFCPVNGCKNGAVFNNESTWFHCSICTFYGCINCGKPHAKLQPDNEDCLTAAGYKKCPGCEIPSIRISGCHLMTCPNCSTHWNWNSGRKFQEGRDKRNGHYFVDEISPITWKKEVNS
ncbi:MAG: hypothetical protein ABIQ95_13970, partial [Bdellovibrionia bacterium]